MATLILDLDGTTFLWGTNQFLPGAKETLQAFQKRGGQIIFVTRRETTWPEADFTAKLLEKTFPGSMLIHGVSSPRIVINDEGCAAIQVEKDSSWYEDQRAELLARNVQ